MTFFSLLIPRWAIFAAGAALVAGLFGWHAHAVNKVEKAAEARVYAKWAESNRIRNEAAGRCPAAGTVDASPPAGETVDLPSVVFGVLQDHAGQLAEYADRARIAGEACAKSYDSLRER